MSAARARLCATLITTAMLFQLVTSAFACVPVSPELAFADCTASNACRSTLFGARGASWQTFLFYVQRLPQILTGDGVQCNSTWTSGDARALFAAYSVANDRQCPAGRVPQMVENGGMACVCKSGQQCESLLSDWPEAGIVIYLAAVVVVVSTLNEFRLARPSSFDT